MTRSERKPLWGKWIEPKKLSPDQHRGRKVETLSDLVALAELRRAVTVPSYHGFEKPWPASIVVHMPAMIVHEMIRRGIYLYCKEGDLA